MHLCEGGGGGGRYGRCDMKEKGRLRLRGGQGLGGRRRGQTVTQSHSSLTDPWRGGTGKGGEGENFDIVSCRIIGVMCCRTAASLPSAGAGAEAADLTRILFGDFTDAAHAQHPHSRVIPWRP